MTPLRSVSGPNGPDFLPVVAATTAPDSPIDLAAVESGLAGSATVRLLPLPPGRMSAAEELAAAAALADVAGVLLRVGYLSARLMAALPRLRVVALHGSGVDQVDIVAARDLGIVVTNVPGANAQAVAELAMGLMLAVMRRICASDHAIRAGQWQDARVMGQELGGKTLGVVGYGNVGRRVAALGTAFGMSVLAFSPHRPVVEQGIEAVDLASLLSRSDVITLHAPLTPDTTAMIGPAQLALMKPAAVLINTARGPLVDEAALVTALAGGRLGGAGLDVFAHEPLPVSSELLRFANVVTTAHIGGSTAAALARIAQQAGQDIARVLRGEPPLHPAL